MSGGINLRENIVWWRRIRHVSNGGRKYPIITLPAEFRPLIGKCVEIKIVGENEILLRITGDQNCP